MKKLLLVLLIFTLGSAARADDPAESYADVYARASQLDGTAEGKNYAPVFSKAATLTVVNAIRDCVVHAKMPDAIRLVLILDLDGSVRRAVPEPGQPVAACVAARLNGLTFPPPPRSGWAVSVNVNIK